MNIDILSNLVITKVYSVSSMYTPKDKGSSRKDRRRWAIIIKYEGETLYTSNGKTFLSDIDHMVILPKGCSYDWVCTKAGHFSTIEFESDATFTEPLTFSPKNSEKILKILKELEYKRTIKNAMTEIESIKDTYSIILALAQTEHEKYLPTEKQRKISSAIEYISQNYNKKISNDTLALLSGMSTVYFRKLFTQTVGVSPIVYARELRIEKAKEMLKSDYGTISDVAQSLGYSNLYDFSRDFKKHVGVSPSKY